MKTKIYVLNSIAVTALVTLGATLPVLAEERGSARFEFAPNMFRREQANQKLPGKMVEGGSNGNVPHGGASVLGLNSKLLEKPHVVQTTVAATPSFTQPAPVAPAPNMPAAPAFGKPGSKEATPAVAQAKAGNFGKPASAKPSSLNSNRDVHGKLLHRPMHYRVPVGLAAKPKALDTYGKGFGYSPGPMVQPPTENSGTSASKDVYGRLLRK